MASLNANTTGSRAGALDAGEDMDLLNQYGDEAVDTLAAEEPDLYALLGAPSTESEGAARKLTGRIPMLPLQQQEYAYNRLEEFYKRAVEDAKSRGRYALEAQNLPLKAVTLESLEAVPARDNGSSPFNRAVTIEKVEADRITRSMSPEQALEAVQGYLRTEESDWRRLGDMASNQAMTDIQNLRGDWVRYLNILNNPENKFSPKDIERARASATAYFDLRRQLVVGRPIMLTMDGDTKPMTGMVVNIRYHKPESERGNPVQPSKTTVLFAPINGIRALTVPLSKIKEVSGSTLTRDELLEVMRKGGEGSREQRYILTGNILSAYEYANGQGQIARFTRADGTVSAGIYMPADWDYRKRGDANLTFRSADDAVAFWRTYPDAVIVDAGSGTILNLSKRRDGPVLIVPKAKSTGGTYFLNRPLRDALGRDFVSVGSQMRAEFSDSQAEAVIRALFAIGPIKPHNHLDAMAPKGAQPGAAGEGAPPSASIPDPSLEPTPQEIGTLLTPEAIRRIAGPNAAITYESGQYRITGSGGVEVFVRMPRTREELQRAKEMGAAGYYDRDTNSIILIPSKATPFTLTHELVHFFKATGLITPSEWSALVDVHAAKPDAVEAKAAAYRDAGVSLTTEQAQEEIVAEALERAHQRLQQDPPGVLGKLRRFFRAIAIGLGLRRLDAEDVEQRILRGDMLAREPGDEDPDSGDNEETTDAARAGQPDERHGGGLDAQRRSSEDDSVPPDSPRKQFSIPDDITAVDPEVEAQLRQAHGVGHATLHERAAAVAEWLRKGVRHFSELSTHEYAEAIAILRRWESEQANAGHLAARLVERHVVGLTPEEMRAFERKLVFMDLAKDVANGLYDGNKKLPLGLKSPEALQGEIDRLDTFIRAHPAVRTALDKRAAFQAEHVRRLVDAGLLPESVLTDEVYYHHMVLEHARERMLGNDDTVTRREDLRQSVQGWQRGRTGSDKPYNVAYVQAEHAYLASSLRALATADALAQLKDRYDIINQVRAEAKRKNAAAMQELWEQENTQPDGTRTAQQMEAISKGWDHRFRVSIAIGTEDALRHLAFGVFRPGQFDELRAAARAHMALPEAEREAFTHPDWWAYLSWAAEQNPSIELVSARGAVSTVSVGLPPRIIFKAVAEREALLKARLGRDYRTWRQEAEAKEGYALWQPKEGQRMALMDVPTSKAMEQALANAGISSPDEVDVLPISTKGMRRALVVVGSQPTWVIPAPLARQLDDVSMRSNPDGRDVVFFARFGDWVGVQWKALILNNPFRVPAFIINNLSGDIDISLTYPAIWKHVPTAVADTWRYVYQPPGDTDADRDMELAARMGLLDAGVSSSDLPDLSRDDFARRIYGTSMSAGAVAAEVGRTLIGQGAAIRRLHQVREGAMRVAAFRYFRGTISPRKRVYGASSHAELDQLYNRWMANPKQGEEMRATIAAKLARELIGDYGNLSVNGQWLRRTLVPFWSWMEINAPRYLRLIRNARYEGGTGVGRAAGVVVARGAGLAAKAGAFYVAVMAWNAVAKAMFGIDDDEDPNKDHDLARLIIITGRDDDGSVTGIRAAGALADALGWLGLADLPSKIDELTDAYRRGEEAQGWQDLAADVGMAPVNRSVNAISPIFKAPGEMFAGKSVFPDLRQPRVIRDRGQYVANTLGYGAPYRWYSDRSDAGDALKSVVVRTRNPASQAWFDARTMAYDYIGRHGLPAGAGIASDKSTALYEARIALMNGERDRAVRWLRRYVQAGGNERGLKASVAAQNPITRIPVKHRQAFLASLSSEQRSTFDKGLRFWREKLAGADDLKGLLREASTPNP
jgi:hypothetical protein